MLGTACMLSLGGMLGAPIGMTLTAAIIFWTFAR